MAHLSEKQLTKFRILREKRNDYVRRNVMYIQKKQIIRGMAIAVTTGILFDFTGINVSAKYYGINAAQYAIDNVKDGNPSYYNPNYYRADRDCTNFVSQCLEAGGKQRTGAGTGYSDMSVWHPHRTTWENANNFKKYWKKRCNNFSSYNITNIETLNRNLYDNYWSGDIIQYATADDVAHHSQIIIGQKSYNGQASLRMAQHTSDDKHISLLQYLSTTGYKKIKVFKFNTWK